MYDKIALNFTSNNVGADEGVRSFEGEGEGREAEEERGTEEEDAGPDEEEASPIPTSPEAGRSAVSWTPKGRNSQLQS